jgi:NADH dehydrogenase/NADH:ubiquinone oxidoreductase subunit G
VSEEITRVAELYVKASNPVIVTSPVFFEAATNVALIKGAALSVPIEANAKGALIMGLKGNGKGYREMSSDGMKILYVIGDVSMKRPAGVDFLIVQTSHMTELAKEADLVIPVNTFFEASGTVVDYMGRLKTVRAAIEPFAESKSTIDIIKALSKKMGLKVKPASSADVKKQLKAFKVELTPTEFKERDDLSYNPSDFIPQSLSTMIQSSRLLWLREVQAQTA